MKLEVVHGLETQMSVERTHAGHQAKYELRDETTLTGPREALDYEIKSAKRGK